MDPLNKVAVTELEPLVSVSVGVTDVPVALVVTEVTAVSVGVVVRADVDGRVTVDKLTVEVDEIDIVLVLGADFVDETAVEVPLPDSVDVVEIV